MEDTGYDWGYIDVLGREIIKCQYDEAGDFDEYERAGVRKGKDYYLIDTRGKAVGNSAFDMINYNSCKAGTYIVEKDGKAGIIDSCGKYVLAPDFDDIRSFVTGLSAVCLEGKWGFMNEELEIVIPCKFDKVGDFYIPEYTDAKSDGKCGIIDITGEWVIEPQYELMFTPFSTEYFGVFDNEMYFYIDKNGRVVSDFYSDFIEWEHNEPYKPENTVMQFPEPEFKYPYLKDYSVEVKEHYCNVLDADGKTVFTVDADYVSEFQPDGYAVFDKDNKYGIIDRFGRVVIPARYKGISGWNMDDY